MITAFLVTCEELPDLDPDDRLVADALADLGARVRPAVWTDESVGWASADVCVIRSTWDYHKRFAEFSRWLDAVSAQTCLLNPAGVVRWNSHKFYLRELEKQGVPIVPTVWLRQGTEVDFAELAREHRLSEAVIKPAYGASADGILKVGLLAGERAAAQAYLRELLAEQDVLLQPFLPAISAYHERALVFIDGAYSHAVSKAPFMHANADLSNRAYVPPGASGEIPVEASREEIALAASALSAAPHGHLYARVDLVRDGDSIRVLEVELIEPTLYLYARPASAGDFACAIVRRVTARPDPSRPAFRLKPSP